MPLQPIISSEDFTQIPDNDDIICGCCGEITHPGAATYDPDERKWVCNSCVEKYGD